MRRSMENTVQNKFIVRKHHGRDVWVRRDLAGKHREHCLCYQCVRFTSETECPIAKDVFSICLKHGITTPVWECPEFVEDPNTL